MTNSKSGLAPRWVLYALLCIFWWGVWGFLAKLGSDLMAPLQLQVLFTMGMIPVALIVLVRAGMKIQTDKLGAIYGILNGVLTGLGLLAYYSAMGRQKAAIVGPVTSLFPLITIALAFLFLRERVNRVQAAGIVLALIAAVIFSK